MASISGIVRFAVVSLLLCLALVSCGDAPSPEPDTAATPFTRETELPDPELDGPVSLNQAIRDRISMLDFAAEPLPTELL